MEERIHDDLKTDILRMTVETNGDGDVGPWLEVDGESLRRIKVRPCQY